MAKTLLIAFSPEEASLLSGFAEALGQPHDVLNLCGQPSAPAAEKILSAGLDSIPPADASAREIARIAENYSHVAAVSSMASKDVMARAAALLKAAMITDVTAVESATVFLRPVMAGAVIARVEALQTPVVLTVRPAGFPKSSSTGSAVVESVAFDTGSKVRRRSASSRSGARPDLTQAKVVVSGGRPLKDAATFEKVVGGLADALGGAVGATRAAVDSGIAPNELQVGQTGKIVAPDLYIAAGISGSTQHMAGIKDSKVIVAINKDPDAPIFQVADYGLVADLYDALPALQAKLGR
jgi:electron transfer flavoprotein alpha subunit